MKPVFLIVALLAAPGLARAQTPPPAPAPTASPAVIPELEISADEKPAADPAALAPVLREEVNLADTESAESMEIPVAADAPDPDKAGVLTEKLPGDDATPEPPPVTGTVQVTAKDNGKVVAAAVGNLVRITLESNPSTGYNWELRDFEYGAAIFNSSDLVARKSGNVLMGAPGDTIIVLQAVEPGTQQITAVYRRPWEAPDQFAATFSFQLEVEAPPATPAP
jgi:predicted secreted protein